MASPNIANFSFKDFNGKAGSMGLFVGTESDPSNLAALSTALKNGSNAGLQKTAITVNLAETDTATDATYENCKDKAIFEFYCGSTGEYVRVGVPAPDDDMFQANQSDIDPIAVLSAAIITQVIASGTSNSGAPITAFTKGWRSRIN